jgi:hypothetical protein
MFGCLRIQIDAVFCEALAKKARQRNIHSTDEVGKRLAGANGSCKRKIGLQAAINLDRCITRAKNAFPFGPFRYRSGEPAASFAKELQTVVIHPHKAETAHPRSKIGSNIVQLSENLEVLCRQFSVVDSGSFKNALGNRLGSDADNQRAPVVDGKLA